MPPVGDQPERVFVTRRRDGAARRHQPARSGDATLSRSPSSLPASYFEQLYAENGDPWGFATSGYEAAKYDATINALPEAAYASALEVGCSIGVLTQRLAPRCRQLLSVDPVEAALDQARERCRDQKQATFARMRLPEELPEGSFDLIMLSEVVYYWDASDVARIGAFIKAALVPGGDVLMVHWLGETNYPLSGDQAVDKLIESLASFTRPLKASRREHYRLDLLRRTLHQPVA